MAMTSSSLAAMHSFLRCSDKGDYSFPSYAPNAWPVQAAGRCSLTVAALVPRTASEQRKWTHEFWVDSRP